MTLLSLSKYANFYVRRSFLSVIGDIIDLNFVLNTLNILFSQYIRTFTGAYLKVLSKESY